MSGRYTSLLFNALFLPLISFEDTIVQPSAPKWRTFELRVFNDLQCTVLTFVNKDLRLPTIVKDMESEMTKVVGFINTPRLVIDFTGVDNASSAVFGLVLAIASDAGAKGISARVCSLAPVMRKAFEMLSAKDLVEVFDNLKIACVTPWDKKKESWWPF